jgi:hypothetical protein
MGPEPSLCVDAYFVFARGFLVSYAEIGYIFSFGGGTFDSAPLRGTRIGRYILAVETGDIMVFSKGFGHVAMVYDGKRVVHGQYKGNFHLENLETQKEGVINHFSDGAKIHKFPWEKYSEGEKAGYQARIQNVAKVIMHSSKYGLYRATRLKLGSSKYGGGAYGRLMKYRERMASGGDGKVVSTITCSEAAILCLQLTFMENAGPGFIKLDGAHTMPATLGKWLDANWR